MIEVNAKISIKVDGSASMQEVKDQINLFVEESCIMVDDKLIGSVLDKSQKFADQDGRINMSFKHLDDVNKEHRDAFRAHPYAKGDSSDKRKGKGKGKDDFGNKDKGKGKGKEKGVYAEMSMSSADPVLRVRDALNKFVLSADFKPDDYNMTHHESEEVKATARSQLGL